MKLISALAALAALSATPSLAAGLVNGGFEQPGTPGVFFLTPGSTFITGWTVVDTTADFDNDVQYTDNSFAGLGVHSSEGSHWLDLTGNTGHGKGVVSDAVAVTPGGSYQVAFDVGAFDVAGYGSFGDATVDLLVNGVFAGSFTNTMDLSAPGSDWQRFTYNFIAGGPTVNLTFLSSTSASSSVLGVGLDNVTLDSRGDVAGVPEPASWATMLLGFAGVGGGLRMARRRTRLASAMG